MGTIAKSRFFGLNSIRHTILDPNNTNGVWEDVSPTEVRLKPNIKLKKEIVRELAKGDFNKIWAILRQASVDASSRNMILIAVICCIGLLLIVALGWVISFNAQFTVYQDDRYGFSIKYPKTWSVVKHPRTNVAVIFLRPKDTVFDTVQENFNVTIQPVPTEILNLEAFSAKIKEQMIAVFGKSINIVKERSLQWDWREGHMIILEAPRPDHLKMVNAWVLRGNLAYIMTFLGDMNKYSADALIVNEMIRSLQLK